MQLVKKLLNLRNANEIALNIDCKGTVKANFGWSPLHLATYFGHYEVVEILLKNGADVNGASIQDNNNAGDNDDDPTGL